MTVAKSNDTSSDVIIHSLDEIPSFASEDEEFEYWATHRFGPEILDQMGPLPDEVRPRRRERPVSLKLSRHALARVKALAERRHVSYQELLEQFIAERLHEEEKRDGLVG